MERTLNTRLASRRRRVWTGGSRNTIHKVRMRISSAMRAGSVTIGGMQTGVAVLTSPNGWNAIGWAEIAMFDPQRQQPSLMLPGDRVRFRIDRIEL